MKPTSKPKRAPRLLILAGEPSGDSHGAELVRKIKELRPDVEIEAWGGPKLKAAGARLHEDLVQNAVMGLFPVLAKLPYFIGVYRRVIRRIRDWKPDLVIPIDYPGLNLRLARKARRIGARVLYYVSPQVWAWWRSRVRKIARAVDKMLVLFPFEVELYREYDVPVEYVGHPLFDAIASEHPDEGFRERLGIAADEAVVALLPGSRDREIRKLLPLFLNAARRLREAEPAARFVLAAARPAYARAAVAQAEALGFPLLVVEGQAHDLMREARIGLVASGTATLECLSLGLPIVIVYRVNWLGWLVAKLILATDHIGLANVVAGKRAVPEFLDWRDRPQVVADAAAALYRDGEERERCLRDLALGRRRLGDPGASERAARAAIAMLPPPAQERATGEAAPP